jgi:hypothetical protein
VRFVLDSVHERGEGDLRLIRRSKHQARSSDTIFPGFGKWRATHNKPDGGILNVFFWAEDRALAEDFIRQRYPLAVFSHEVCILSTCVPTRSLQ